MGLKGCPEPRPKDRTSLYVKYVIKCIVLYKNCM